MEYKAWMDYSYDNDKDSARRRRDSDENINTRLKRIRGDTSLSKDTKRSNYRYYEKADQG